MPSPYVTYDVVPWTQSIAGGTQYVFSTNWTVNSTSDVVVYNRLPSLPANDITQLVDPSLYNVELIGSDNTVQVTFITAPLQNNIVTIMRNTPYDFLNTYTNTNFLPSMLNSDFQYQLLLIQQNLLKATQFAPHYANSASVTLQDSISGDGNDEILPLLGPNQLWVMNSDGTAIGAVDFPEGGSGGGASVNNYYLVSQNAPDLPNSVNLGLLNTGLIFSTVTGDISSISVIEPSANQILYTDGSGLPVFGNMLPAVSLTGTMDTNGQEITNALTNGNLELNTNGTGKFNLNSTDLFTGVSNDDTMAANSPYLLPTQAAVKAYVATVAGGFEVVGQVTAVQTTNFAATYVNGGSGGVGATLTQSVAAVVTVDGVTLTLNQRVLFTAQTNTYENGVYQISTLGTGAVQAIFTRVTDYDTAAEILPGTLIPVASGTVYAGSIWLQTQTVTTVGTDPILFITYAQPGDTYVTLAGTQSITGAKTFTQQLTAPSIAFTSNSGIIGTTTNDSAAIGSVGETMSLNIPAASSVSVLNNTSTNIGYLDLTAGSWMVWGNITFQNTSTSTAWIGWISSTSATIPDVSYRQQITTNIGAVNSVQGMAIAPQFFKVPAATTVRVYLEGYTSFSAGTSSACGNIYAERFR
jgi:hypothetical protein